MPISVTNSFFAVGYANGSSGKSMGFAGCLDTAGNNIADFWFDNPAYGYSGFNSVCQRSDNGIFIAGGKMKESDGRMYGLIVKLEIPVESISLTKKNLSLNIDYAETLKYTINPSEASNKRVTWKSSNTAVATVSAAGSVTSKAAGTATITVTTVDGG